MHVYLYIFNQEKKMQVFTTKVYIALRFQRILVGIDKYGTMQVRMIDGLACILGICGFRFAQIFRYVSLELEILYVSRCGLHILLAIISRAFILDLYPPLFFFLFDFVQSVAVFQIAIHLQRIWVIVARRVCSRGGGPRFSTGKYLLKTNPSNAFFKGAESYNLSYFLD